MRGNEHSAARLSEADYII